MAAPTIGGATVPMGNGQSITLPRGASLTDFADKIGANPASLVSVLFKLGEMVTATESVNDDTLALLGAGAATDAGALTLSWANAAGGSASRPADYDFSTTTLTFTANGMRKRPARSSP